MLGKRLTGWLILTLVLSLIVASCSSGSGSGNKDAEPASVSIMYWSEMGFNQDFGIAFYATHPHIDVQVIDSSSVLFNQDGGDYNEMMDEFIREKQPDILMLSQEQYEKYAAEGRIVSLESFVTRDKFDLEGMIPGVVDLLREKGGGELYGLSPTFTSRAIYYNKDLFDRFGIEYPTDRMSWEDLFNLAARFPTDGSDEDRIYGLSIGTTDLHQIGQQIGGTMGLRLVNPADKRVSLDTDSWVRAYEIALNAIRSGTLYQEDYSDFPSGMSYQDFLLRDPFIAGKVAMSLNHSYLLEQIREAANSSPDRAVKNWDIVTLPVDPANPEFSYEFSLGNIYAINAESPNREAAWEFIRYIHSDDYARVKSKSFNGQFPIRTKYIEDKEGRNLTAFYALKPSGHTLYDGIADLPGNFYMQYFTIGTEEMQAVLNEEKTVREALASMQTRLQAALDEELAKQKNESGADSNQDPAGAADEGASAAE